MADNKTIAYSALAAILATLIIVGGVKMTDPKAYYCEAKKTLSPCDSLSSYYGIPNGKCNSAQFGNKLCSSGWIKPTPNQVIEEPMSSGSSAWGIKSVCDSVRCVAKP